MFQVVDHTRVSRNDWREFIINHPDGTIFHTPYMFDVFLKAKDYKPFALFALNEGQIVGVFTGFVQAIGVKLFSRFTNRAVAMQTPLFLNQGALDALLNHYNKYFGNKVVYTEIRNHVDTKLVSNVFKKYRYEYEAHLDILMDLTSPEEDILSRMASTRRKQINRGYKRGLEVKVIDNDDRNSINECFNIVCSLYDKLGLPKPDINMIMAAFSGSTTEAYPICFAALYQGQIIGTRIVLCYRDRIFDWYAASIEEHYDKYPNDVLPVEVLKWGHANGFRVFDFGGAGKPGVPYGVRDYKLKFGGELVEYGRYQYAKSSFRLWIAQTGFNLLRKVINTLHRLQTCGAGRHCALEKK